jgi:hypothetical protein
MPPHRHVRHESEPHLWTVDEIRRVLAVIDRQSACGKRDYAMILTTARHASSDTTQSYYLRFDVERLRCCALDVEDVIEQGG